MGDSKILISVTLYIKEGEEKTFDEYEAHVLPLAANHNGRLVYRLRPDRKNFLNEPSEYPYEIHLLEFDSEQDYKNYLSDPLRNKFAPFRDKSVLKTVVVKGNSL